jgi:hypothetical protein
MTTNYEGPEIVAGGGLEDDTDAHGGWSRWVNIRDALAGAVPMPEVFLRTDERASFYRGQVNALVGESEGGKSLIAQAAVVATIAGGGHAVYLDHESDAVSVVSRLVSLGAAPDDLEARLHYMTPEGLLTPAEAERFLQYLETTAPELVVVDGLTAAMESQGLNLNDNKDAAGIFRTYLNPMCSSGAAVVAIHHVTKANDGRGTYGLGAVTLKNLIGGAQYGIETAEESRHTPGGFGSSRLVIHKDRAGGVRMFARKRVWATFATSSSPTGEHDAHGRPLFRTEWQLKTPGEGLENGPTACMEAVSRYLEALGEPASERDVVAADLGAGFVKRTRQRALRELEDGGYITKGKGPKAYAHAAPYREPTEDVED